MAADEVTVKIKFDGLREVNDMVEDYAWLVGRLEELAEKE